MQELTANRNLFVLFFLLIFDKVNIYINVIILTEKWTVSENQQEIISIIMYLINLLIVQLIFHLFIYLYILSEYTVV